MFGEQFLDLAFCKINTALKRAALGFWMTGKVVQNARTPKQLHRSRAVIHLALLLSFDGD